MPSHGPRGKALRVAPPGHGRGRGASGTAFPRRSVGTEGSCPECPGGGQRGVSNFAPRTIQVYVERVATFAKHLGKSPDRLGPADVRAYLLFLVNEKRASWCYYNQA